MKIIYMSDDGVTFENEMDCIHHEWMLYHPHLKDVHIYDENGNEYEDLFSEDTYSCCERIVVETEDAVKDLHALAELSGFEYYYHVKEVGTWKYIENGIMTGEFVKVKSRFHWR